MSHSNFTTNRTSIKDVQWIFQGVRYIWIEYLVVFLFAATILANITLVIVLLKSRHHRTNTLTCHMLNVATAQLLLGLFSVPFANFGHWGLLQWLFQRVNVPLCYVSFIVDRLLIVSTLLAVLMLATDCLMYITELRFGNELSTQKKIRLVTMLALPWCVSICCTSVLTINTRLVFFEDIRGCSPLTELITESIVLFVCIVIPATLLLIVIIGLLLFNKIGAQSITRLFVHGDPLQVGNRICLGCLLYLFMWTWFLKNEVDKGIGCKGNVQCLLKFHDGPVPYAIACANAAVTPAVWTLFPEIRETLKSMVRCYRPTRSLGDGYLRHEAVPLNHVDVRTGFKVENHATDLEFSQPV